MPKIIVACIVIDNAKVFNWLGHMPVLQWSVDQLLKVRGVSRIICVTSWRFADKTKKVFTNADDDSIPTIIIPRKVEEQQQVEVWLGGPTSPAPDADVIFVLRPTNPFMPAAKMELCIDTVTRQHADTCAAARCLDVLISGSRQKVHAEVPSCRAFAPARVNAGQRAIKAVSVNLVESLDVSDHASYRIVTAMVQGGAV